MHLFHGVRYGWHATPPFGELKLCGDICCNIFEQITVCDSVGQATSPFFQSSHRQCMCRFTHGGFGGRNECSFCIIGQGENTLDYPKRVSGVCVVMDSALFRILYVAPSRMKDNSPRIFSTKQTA